MNLNMDIGQAMNAIKQGRRVTSQRWRDRGMYLELVPKQDDRTVRGNLYKVVPDKWIGMRLSDDSWIWWSFTQTDLLATDYELWTE